MSVSDIRMAVLILVVACGTLLYIGRVAQTRGPLSNRMRGAAWVCAGLVCEAGVFLTRQWLVPELIFLTIELICFAAAVKFGFLRKAPS